MVLELTPPAQISRSPEATQELFVNLYGLFASRKMPAKLLPSPIIFAPEIVSTCADGVRFTMRVPKRKVMFFMQAIFTYNQAIQIKQVADYMPVRLDRSKLGKYYSAYHCSKQGHYFRISKEKMENTVQEFVKNFQLTPEYINTVMEAVVAEWDRRQTEEQGKLVNHDERIASLRTQASAIANKIKILTTEIAIKCMEDELVKIDTEIAAMEKQKQEAAESRPLDIHT